MENNRKRQELETGDRERSERKVRKEDIFLMTVTISNLPPKTGTQRGEQEQLLPCGTRVEMQGHCNARFKANRLVDRIDCRP